MKPSLLFALALCALGASRVLAQTPAAPATSASAAPTTNAAPRRGQGPPPVRSAVVDDDRRVTFRLRAPKATEIAVNGQWPDGRAPMTKDTNGVWSVTVGPVPSGVWEYGFQVDGVGMIDPGNPAIKPMREPRTSILHIPGEPPLIHDFRDVPHGVVRQHTYRSSSLNRLRELAVYTPPGYDQNPSAQFPLLVLQHGSGDNQATWVAHGKAHWILDNLFAQGRAVPMVVVMLDGHAAVASGGGGPQNNTALFERDLLEDALPLVESAYRLKPGAVNRAIVGLSMGGGQSLTIGLKHTDRFAWVGGFSASVPSAESVGAALGDPATTNGRLRLLWIACGKDDFLLRRNEDFIATLKERTVRHEWRLTEGNHSWPVWRTYLAEFTPLLFQP
ncbi:MAG: alpha/beta hydrolase-fold protein [Limisphaerales bacterium]